tara:strand:+ start:1546 stop:1746 length:201 start_codon:yes stop_codon:yes gene_type:complete
MRKFFSTETQIKLLKKAIKKGEQDPFLYNDEELIKLKTSLSNCYKEKELTRQITNRGFGYDQKVNS